MTTIFSDGFESGDLSAWTSSNGGSAVTTSPHHGIYCYRTNSDYQRVLKTFTQGSEFYVRFYYKLNTDLSNGDTLRICKDFTGGRVWINVTNTGSGNKWGLAIQDENETSKAYTSTQTITAEQWYCVELWWKADTSNGAKLYIDGSLILTAADKTIYYAISGFSLGCSVDSGTAKTQYFDCAVIADTYIGPESTSTLKTVNDSLLLTDVSLRHKVLSVSDSVGTADSDISRDIFLITLDAISLTALMLVNKSCNISDSSRIDESASLPSCTLKALDSIGITEDLKIQKAIIINEATSIVETVEAGSSSGKKTRLFLVLGDLAIELTGN